MINFITALLIIALTCGIFVMVVYQPHSFSCGTDIHSLHLWIYGLIIMILVVLLIYIELILVYFLKLSRDKKIGFLMEKKSHMKRLIYKLMLIMLILSTAVILEMHYFNALYRCFTRIQVVEITPWSLVIKWAKINLIIISSYLVFNSFKVEKVEYTASKEKLICMDRKYQKKKSLNLQRHDTLDIF